MGHTSDYICDSCGFIIENFEKLYGQDFPSGIECPKCKSMTRRYWKTSTPKLIIPEIHRATHEG